MKKFLIFLFLFVFCFGTLPFHGETVSFTDTVLWERGMFEAYSNTRIPGIVITKENTVIVYCEARATGSDWADMDLMMQRSTDGGDTFETPILLAQGVESKSTLNNPVMIVGNDNTLHFLYCEEYAINGHGVYYRRSTDDGQTWSEPVNLGNSALPEYRNVLALGPGHGICLDNGTLLVPVWMVPKEAGASVSAHHPAVISTFYSTDDGDTWQIGEILPATETVGDPNETVAVQLSDGRVMLNVRVGAGEKYRAVAISPNGYEDWTPLALDKELMDPVCFGSIVAGDGILWFVNCESQHGRKNLTVKGSTDDGETWTLRKVINAGSAGYSDIAVAKDGTVFVLYEVDAGVSVRLARFNRAWVEQEPPKAEPNSLVLYYDGTVEHGAVADKSGLLNTVSGNGITVDTRRNGCLYTDGSGNINAVTQETGLDMGTGDFTFSLCVRTKQLEGQQFLAWSGQVGGGKAQWWVRLRDRDVQFNLCGDGTAESTLTATDVLKKNVWTYLTFVRRGTNQEIYVNGIKKAEKAVPLLDVGPASGMALLREKNKGTRNFNGYADEIRIYNYALSPNEIKELCK